MSVIIGIELILEQSIFPFKRSWLSGINIKEQVREPHKKNKRIEELKNG